MLPFDIFTALLSAILILMVWSLLYRETVFFRIAEQLAVGTMMGFSVYQALDVIWNKTLIPTVTQGGWSNILVTILGVLLWVRLIPQVRWVSRWSLAVLAGVSMGVGVRGALSAQLIGQTVMTGFIVAGDAAASIGNFVVLLLAVGSIVYFLYTREPKGAQGFLSQVGRLALMVAFGAVLGTFLLANVAFPISEIPTLITWPGYWISAVAVLLIVMDIYRQNKRIPAKSSSPTSS